MLLANAFLSALLCLLVAANAHSEGEEGMDNSPSANVHDLLRKGNSECKACQERQDHQHPDAQSIKQDIPNFQYVIGQELPNGKSDKSDQNNAPVKNSASPKFNSDEETNEVDSADQVVEPSPSQPDSERRKIDADLTKESQGERSFSESATKDSSRYMEVWKEIGIKYGNLFLVHAHQYGTVLWTLAGHYGQIGLVNLRIYGNLATESLKKYGKLGAERAKKFGRYSFRKAIQAKDYAQSRYSAYLSERAKKSQSK
ncbi:hypothetical protein PSACC_03361 [Paramicrosporidium saccamoebae]|uniref:Uncharacterized protein n=1 Tax=Paramicrosporidium saccamoebae TaxID=1246581 RepID=A0A2H9TGD0_9FUNG|nr:hypothetical protein PSACC_03361 [Paramicrosporidium saccamoebae]